MGVRLVERIIRFGETQFCVYFAKRKLMIDINGSLEILRASRMEIVYAGGAAIEISLTHLHGTIGNLITNVPTYIFHFF